MKSRIIKDYLAYLWLSFFHCSCDAIWAHHDYQPWGMALPMQCPQCGTIQKWMSIYLQNNGYRYECGYPRCGYDDEARQAWPYAITVERPKGATLLKCHGGQGGWMKICELSC